MKFTTHLSNDSVLSELGRRLAQARINSEWTQAMLAQEAGVSKRTVERLEAGGSIQSVNLIRVLRALNLLENLEAVAPDTGPRPMDLLKLGKPRQRVSLRNKTVHETTTPWTWGDEKDES